MAIIEGTIKKKERKRTQTNPNSLKNLEKGFWKPGQSGNPGGRPKHKGVSVVNDLLEREGYKTASKNEIESNYLRLINLPEEELLKIDSAEELPMLTRIVARSILERTAQFDVVERIIDRAIGRPTQKVEQRQTVSLEYSPPEVEEESKGLQALFDKIKGK